jgi:hypothetical protein
VVERAVSGLEAEGKVSVHGDRVTRREIIYDERGRVAGEEMVHKNGRRDATAFPETVRAVANVGGPTRASEVRNVELTFQAPEDAELEIVMEREEFHPFQFKANFLEAKIRVRNKTPKTKYIKHTQWEIDPPEDNVHNYITDIEVHRALHALKERRPPELHGIIAPNDTIAGWLHIALPHQPWGGIGGFAVTIEDELGVQYVLRRDRRGGRDPAATL